MGAKSDRVDDEVHVGIQEGSPTEAPGPGAGESTPGNGKGKPEGEEDEEGCCVAVACCTGGKTSGLGSTGCNRQGPEARLGGHCWPGGRA